MTSPDTSREQYDTLWRDLWANTHAGGPMARTRYRLAMEWLGFSASNCARVLDVGAGNGAFMSEALKRAPGLQIFGAEFSQAAIDIAHPSIRERLALCDLQGQQSLPWGGGFGIVTCMEVLEHLPDDELPLRHISEALTAGGTVFISVPAWQSRWSRQDETAGHVRRYEPTELRVRIERAGLRVTRLKCWGGVFSRIYLRAATLIGPERVMSVRPSGLAGLLAASIYQLLKIDDVTSYGRGEQLLVLATKS
jgi:SAM-dependent methyltransferase